MLLPALLRDPRSLALADQLIVSTGTFTVTVVAARTLDTAAFGAFSLTLLVSLLLANLHRAVITQPLNVLGTSDNDAQASARLTNTLGLNGSLAALALVLFGVVGAVVGLSASDILLGWLAFVGFSYQDTLRRYAYTRGNLNLAWQLSALAQLSLFVCLAAALSYGFRNSAAFLVSLSVSACLTSAWSLRRLHTRVTWTWAGSSQAWQEHRPVAQWLVLTVAAVWGASQLYLLMAAALGPLAVAHLAAARNILNGLGPLAQTIANYAPSRVSRHLEAGGMAAVRQLLGRYAIYAAAGSLAFITLIFGSGEALLGLLYGPSFREAAPLLCLLAVGYVMILWGTVFGSFCLGLSDSHSGFLSNLAATLFTLSAGIWLTRTFELQGLAWGLVLSLTIATGLQGTFLFRRMRKPAAAGPLPRPEKASAPSTPC